MNAPLTDSEKKAMDVAQKWYRRNFTWDYFTGTPEDFKKLAALLLITWSQGADAKATQLDNRYGFSELEPTNNLENPPFNVKTLPSAEKK